MYLELSWTPNAVVASVIVFNAAFGYRWESFHSKLVPMLIVLVFLVGDLYLGYIHPKYLSLSFCLLFFYLFIHTPPTLDNASDLPRQGRFVIHRH